MREQEKSEDYKDHAPYIEDDTTFGELYRYTKRQTKNPLEYNGCIVYDYSSHKHDPVALNEATYHAEDGKYIIPFQVPTAFCAMWEVLPEDIKKEADFLIYRTHAQEYTKYQNFMRRDRVSDWEIHEYKKEIQEG